jgi:hypothetical protein
VVGFAAAAGIAWAMAAVRRGVRRRRDEAVARFATDYPRVVAAWGGPDVLHGQETLSGLLAELTAGATPPDRPPSPTVALSPEEVTADPTRKEVLVARLRDLDQLRTRTRDNVSGTWGGLFALWFTGVPVAVVGVIGVAQEAGWDGMPTAALAVATGLVGAVASWWGMARIRQHCQRKWDEAGDRFAADYPRLIEQWGGRGMLESPPAFEALLKKYDPPAETRSAPLPAPAPVTAAFGPEDVTADPARRAVLVGRLREQARLLRSTANKTIATWVLPQSQHNLAVALPLFLVAAFVVLVGGWWAMAEVRRNLRRKLDETTERFVTDYPRLVEGWGGPVVLRNPEAVDGLLRTKKPIPGRGDESRPR